MNVVMLDDERLSLAVLKNHVSKIEGTHGFVFTLSSDALKSCAANEAHAVIIDLCKSCSTTSPSCGRSSIG
jgi:hypothetical protein